MFNCYGHFYVLKASDRLIRCRSTLEIVDANNQQLNNLEQLSMKKPNAIVIMMNPGGSKPLFTNNPEDTVDINEFHINFNKKELVIAIPDVTQDRIMNVMNVLGWKHVRILNLSDIREKNSNFLDAKLEQFHGSSNEDVHSIFSRVRNEERYYALCQGNTPLIIIGWGTKKCLKTLAKYVLDEILHNNWRYVGIKQKLPCYYHPSRRENWHDDIIDEIKK